MYKLTDQKNHARKLKMRKSRADERVIVSKCGKMVEQDADVKPIVRDPMDDDRILVGSGAEMTPVPHEPSEFEKTETSSHSRPISTMVHIMRQRQSTIGITQTNRAHHRRQTATSQ